MKKLSAVTGEYTKDGQQKAEWTNIGVIGIGKNGKEYVLLDPTINIAGVLAKQNVLAGKRNEAPSDMVMASIFEETVNNQQTQQGGYQQQAPQQGGYNQQAPQQGGYQKQHNP